MVAGGAWAAELLAPLDRTLDVEPQRGQIVHLRLEGVVTDGWPTVVPVGDHYLVAFDGGRIVAGATRETGSGFDVRVTAAGQRQVLDQALALAPGLATATVVETRVGLRPLATGGTPSVGAVPGYDSVFVAGGYGAAGLTMAPVLGDALAELVVTGRHRSSSRRSPADQARHEVVGARRAEQDPQGVRRGDRRDRHVVLVGERPVAHVEARVPPPGESAGERGRVGDHVVRAP